VSGQVLKSKDMIGVLIYILIMPIAFILVSIRAYWVLNVRYYVYPSLQHIWKTISATNDEPIYIGAVILFPIAALYMMFIVIRIFFDFIIRRLFSMLNPEMKLIKAKVELLTVGQDITFVYDDDCGSNQLKESRVKSIENDYITLCSTSRIIKKKNFILHNDNLIGIAERNN
jgi:flagellar biosynthesis protein FlhB